MKNRCWSCGEEVIWGGDFDYEDFLNLRRNTGDERLRCHDMRSASWIPDLFKRKVEYEEEWNNGL